MEKAMNERAQNNPFLHAKQRQSTCSEESRLGKEPKQEKTKPSSSPSRKFFRGVMGWGIDPGLSIREQAIYYKRLISTHYLQILN